MATAIALLGATAQAAQARTDNRLKPVYFVHGYANGSDSDCDQWDQMAQKFRDQGHTGSFQRVGYYHNDVDCNAWVQHHGNHSTHYASGHHDGSHTEDTDIRHLAYHLAWHIRSHFSSEGQAVDIVAHSMGGLITRYALAQVDRDHPDFPPGLKVEDVVTLGTPHGGARFAAWCIGCNTQVQQMEMGSGFLNWLEDYGWSPDVGDGTQWSTMGSDDDNAVAADRAAATDSDRDPTNKYMGSCHKAWYREDSNIEHSDFKTATSSASTADVWVHHCEANGNGGWVLQNGNGLWPVLRADQAITYASH